MVTRYGRGCMLPSLSKLPYAQENIGMKRGFDEAELSNEGSKDEAYIGYPYAMFLTQDGRYVRISTDTKRKRHSAICCLLLWSATSCIFAGLFGWAYVNWQSKKANSRIEIEKSKSCILYKDFAVVEESLESMTIVASVPCEKIDKKGVGAYNIETPLLVEMDTEDDAHCLKEDVYGNTVRVTTSTRLSTEKVCSRQNGTMVLKKVNTGGIKLQKPPGRRLNANGWQNVIASFCVTAIINPSSACAGAGGSQGDAYTVELACAGLQFGLPWQFGEWSIYTWGSLPYTGLHCYQWSFIVTHTWCDDQDDGKTLANYWGIDIGLGGGACFGEIQQW